MDIPKKIGRYEILQEQGQGAMGTVYRALDPAMGRVVAVKTINFMALPREEGSESRERFYREARAAGALAHPGIVGVFDVGEQDGVPFLVMEFVTGRTLADTVKKGERLTPDRTCEIAQKIAEALGYAHRRGVVHRDIKPANILITSAETYGIERPKITDFGLAKLAEGQITLTGEMLGTPAFMSPEQFTGSPVDGRTDIFSLGVVLYWMATGEQPFPGESITAVSYKIVHTDAVPPRRLNPSLPAKLESLILKCLKKKPAERYQRAEELACDLGELRTGDKAAPPQDAAPRGTVAGIDPDTALIESAPKIAAEPVAATQQAGRAVTPEGKRGSWLGLVAAAIVVVLAVAGGWYILRNQQKSAVQAVVPPSAAISVAASVSAPAQNNISKEVVGAAKPAPEAPPKKTSAAKAPVSTGVAVKKPNDKAQVKTVAGSSAKTGAAREPAALGFDPKTLDPKQNARLQIDTKQMPAGLDFTVEMNGKLYFRKTDVVRKIGNERLFVPPGVQELRVTAKSGAVEKASNTVSADFKAKKRITLKIELRIQGMPLKAGVPQGLYPNTQIVAALK